MRWSCQTSCGADSPAQLKPNPECSMDWNSISTTPDHPPEGRLAILLNALRCLHHTMRRHLAVNFLIFRWANLTDRCQIFDGLWHTLRLDRYVILCLPSPLIASCATSFVDPLWKPSNENSVKNTGPNAQSSHQRSNPPGHTYVSLQDEPSDSCASCLCIRPDIFGVKHPIVPAVLYLRVFFLPGRASW